MSATQPLLSICVPSRNRQVYFQQTIRDLIRSERTDIEFVLADNSDDPAMMNAFMAGLDDPRIRYLASVDHCLPMEENWERTLDAVTGKWVTVIGDDDYIDPDLATFLIEIARRAPETEAVGWTKLTYKWPNFRPFAGNMVLPLNQRVQRFPHKILIDRMFRWENATHMPSNPFSVYHGAVRMDVARAIRKNYGGRYFEHPVVDYEFGCKVAHAARNFVYVERPLSVLGTCSESNSAAANNFEKSLENYEALIRETGGGEETSDWLKDFPFRGHLGVSGAIMGVQHWFKSKYRFPVDGWEKNFVQALAQDCRHSDTRRSFELQAELCKRALADWKRGALLPDFNPVYTDRQNRPAYTGIRENLLYIDEAIGDAASPGLVHDVVKQMMPPPSEVTFEFGTASTPLQGISTAA